MNWKFLGHKYKEQVSQYLQEVNKNTPHNYEDYPDCIGQVRTGEVCVDLLIRDGNLWTELFVGGMDSGYGYTEEDDYPYEYFDDLSLMWPAKTFAGMTANKFHKFVKDTLKPALTNLIEEYCVMVGLNGEEFSLIAKADEKLHLW